MRSSNCFFICTLALAALLFVSVPQAEANNCSLESLGSSVKGSRQILLGHYRSSLEHSGFTPCPLSLSETHDSEENRPESKDWWITFRQPDLYRAMEQEFRKLDGSKHEAPADSLFLRIEACISSPGSYGHMNTYPRYIEVIKLLDYRPKGDGDCPSPDNRRKIRRR